jgi:DNA-damage-inducible protein J
MHSMAISSIRHARFDRWRRWRQVGNVSPHNQQPTASLIENVARLSYISPRRKIMASTAFVRARIDEDLKNEAAAVLAEMGLTVSDVVRMTLTRVAKDKALPFDLKIPNAETRAAIEETRALAQTRRARFSNAKDTFDALDEEARRK